MPRLSEDQDIETVSRQDTRVQTASLLMCLLNVHITADDRHVNLSPGDDARSPPMPSTPPTATITLQVAQLSFGDVVETPVKNSSGGEYCQSFLNLPGPSPPLLSLSLCVPFSSYIAFRRLNVHYCAISFTVLSDWNA